MEIAQIDKIMTEINGLEDKGKILLIHRIEELLDSSSENENVPIESVFGIWKDRDITLENIRKRAWRQK